MNERIEVRSAPGARRKRKRVGRGAGSNRGSTCGRGDKGQNSRSGGGVKPGFEGGQMPLQRRLPKRGFHSRSANSVAEVRTSELNKFKRVIITMDRLKEYRVIPKHAVSAKVILSGELKRSVRLRGVRVSAGARAAIEGANGTVED